MLIICICLQIFGIFGLRIFFCVVGELSANPTRLQDNLVYPVRVYTIVSTSPPHRKHEVRGRGSERERKVSVVGWGVDPLPKLWWKGVGFEEDSFAKHAKA